MDGSSDKQSLIDHIENRRFHHLLHQLRHHRFDQSELDKSLHLATRIGQVESARLVVEYGGNVRSLNSKGAPLLLGAVLGGHVDIITLLVIYHYDVNYAIGDSIDTGIGVPLHIAIWKQNIQLVRVLIGAGVALETRDQDGNTALLVSAYVGNTEITDILLRAGCDPNAQDCSGNSLVHVAIATSNMDMLNLAFEYAAVADIPNDDGDTPFLISVKYGNHYMIDRMLQEKDVDFNHFNYEGSNGLHCACAIGDCDILQDLLAIDVDINHVDRFGNTPLLVASCIGHEDVILLLLTRLKRNAVTKVGFKKRNLLHWAAIQNMETAFKFAIECNCFDLELQDTMGNSALVLAIKHKRLVMVEELLIAGCSAAPKDCDHYCPTHWAVETGNVVSLKLLINYGANLFTVNKRIENSLILAVKLGHADMVKLILDSVCDTDRPVMMKQRDVERSSCVHIAAQQGCINILHLLLPFTTKELLESSNKQFESPLAVASRAYSRDAVLVLLQQGCNSSVLDRHGKSPIFYAAVKDDIALLNELLIKDANPNLNESESSPLIEASKLGLAGVVNLLLTHGATVDTPDKYGRSALIWASQKGHGEVVDLLLAQSADPKLVDTSGDTALTVAAFKGQLSMLEKLIPISDINHVEYEENMNALLLAISQQRKECALLLLQHGANINCVTKSGNTSLLMATAMDLGDEIVNAILSCGQEVDVHQCGEMGRCALHWAISDVEALAVLLNRSPVLDSMDDNGATPLLLAIAHGMEPASKLLITAGSNIRLVHGDGRQPIHHASIYGTNTVLRTLLERDIDADTLTLDGRSPLLLASIEGNTQCVKTLIAFGAKIDKIFFNAITPLSVATSEKNYETMNVLLASGADPELIGSKKHRPLISGVLNNDLEGVRILITWGADLDYSHNWMAHPIVVAAMNQRWEMLRLLLRNNENVNVVRYILQNGALLYFVADDVILNLLKAFVMCPSTLTRLCVKTIRNQVKRPIKSNLSLLTASYKIREIITNIQ